METWQVQHIVNHLQELGESTICDNSLMIRLISKSLITPSECEDIEALSVHSEKANRLYRILMKKPNSYGALIEVLNDTGHSGACLILEKAKELDNYTWRSMCKNDEISYDIRQVVGKGCYGTRVYKGTYECEEVAVKVIECDELDVENVTQEVTLLQELIPHNNLVKFFNAKKLDGCMLIAFELCSFSLSECVKDKNYPIERIEILRQVTCGLQHLHSMKIIHRDLKPSNILLKVSEPCKAVVKLSDFGMSKKITGDRSTLISRGFGTQGWVAPEVLHYFDHMDINPRPVKMTYSADVFPLGCVFYYTLSDGKHPFGSTPRCEANILDDKPDVHENDIKLEPSDATRMLHLIMSMIDHYPNKRPDCSDILSNECFHHDNSDYEMDESSLAMDDLYHKLSTNTSANKLFVIGAGARRKKVPRFVITNYKNKLRHYKNSKKPVNKTEGMLCN